MTRGFLGMNRELPPALLEPKVYGEPPNLVVDGMPAYDTINLDPSLRPELAPRPPQIAVLASSGTNIPLVKT